MSIELTTRPGQGLDTTVFATRDLTGYTVAVEFATNSQFKNVPVTTTPVVSARAVALSLTKTQVESLKDSYFRVRATKGGVTKTVADGRIDYLPAPAGQAAPTLDLAGIASSPELRAASVAAPRVHPDLAIVAQLLRGSTRPVGIAAVGDSTTTPWFGPFIDWLATQVPHRTVTRRVWSDAKQGYVSAATVQTGVAGDRYVTSSAAHAVTVNPLVPAGDLDVRAKLALPDWTPAANQTLVSKNGATGNRSWWLDAAPGGGFQLSLSSDGTNFVTVNSTLPHGFSDGSAAWFRFTLDVDNGAGGYEVRFYTSTDGATWTQLGTAVTTAGVLTLFPSTQPVQLNGRGGLGLADYKSYAVRVLSGIDGTPVVDIDLDALPETGSTFTDYAGNTVTLAGTGIVRAGALGLAVFDGSLGGSAITYATDPTRFAKQTPYPCELGIINYSHTGGTATTAYLTDFQAIAAAYLAKWPSVTIWGSAENPQTAPRMADQIAAQAARVSLIRDWLVANRWVVLDAYQAFIDDGRDLATVLVSDGVHPTATGYALWLAKAKSLIARCF